MNQTTNNANPSISCSVSECKHHNNSKNACTLGNITVACSGPTTNSSACTECNSFYKK